MGNRRVGLFALVAVLVVAAMMVAAIELMAEDDPNYRPIPVCGQGVWYTYTDGTQRPALVVQCTVPALDCDLIVAATWDALETVTWKRRLGVPFDPVAPYDPDSWRFSR